MYYSENNALMVSLILWHSFILLLKMQENIYSGIWGETLFKKDIGKRVYLYREGSARYEPSIILDNELAIKNMISFLEKALKEKFI